MSRRCILVLILAGASAGVVWGDDLRLDPDSGFLTIVGTAPGLKNQGNNLTSGVTSNAYLAVYDSSGAYNSSVGYCQLPNNSTVTLATMNTISVQVVVTVGGTTVSQQNTTFSAVQPYGAPGYSYASVSGAYAPTTLTVTVGGSPACTSVAGHPLDVGEFWEITQQPPGASVGTTGFDGGSDGPPVPISGQSLSFIAPKPLKFTCPSSNTAYLEGEPSWLGLAKVVQFSQAPPQPFVFLKDVKSWFITAYPELVEIGKSWWSERLRFTAPPKYAFDCTNPRRLIVVDAKYPKKKIPTPQQFVVTWSSGWLSDRTMTVDCGGCTLQLVPSKK